MSNKINDLPSWEPGQVLDELAHEAGRSRAWLEADLQGIARGLLGENHLNFEQVQRDELSTEQQQHLNECRFCQRLRNALHPSDEIIRAFRIRLGEELAAPAAPIAATRATQSNTASSGKREHVFFQRGPVFAMVASIVAITFGVISYQLHQAATPLNTLSMASQMSVAQTFANEGNIPEANKVLLQALENGGIEGTPLYDAKAVLQKPSQSMTALQGARRALLQSNQTDTGRATELVKLSTRQVQSGQWHQGYKNLGAYLEIVEPNAPATVAFQEKFLAELSIPASKSTERIQ
jgi:hypothetical protein